MHYKMSRWWSLSNPPGSPIIILSTKICSPPRENHMGKLSHYRCVRMHVHAYTGVCNIFDALDVSAVSCNMCQNPRCILELDYSFLFPYLNRHYMRPAPGKKTKFVRWFQFVAINSWTSFVPFCLFITDILVAT